ncbi:MAG: D-aminoacylase [Clostridiales bacterium]|nr:D-aminoacylase [Clostridiales bacterium]
MNRRAFLKKTAQAALIGLGGTGPFLQGCASKKDFDLLVKDGLVYDGLGGKPVSADIAVAHDSIVSIGKIRNNRAKWVIEARNLAVSPGFIDVHDHTDVSLLVSPRAESAIRQGITTLVSGNCGSSPFPIAPAILEEEKENMKKIYGLEMSWTDMKGFLARLEESGMALNYATLVGHGSIRGAIVGFSDRPPTPEELELMKSAVEEHIRDGAFGLSTGLEYAPGSFAQPDEIVELCRVASQLGCVYATHMRDEGDRLLESLDESVAAARQSGVKLQVSHLKVAYRPNWSKIDEALQRIERARRDGVDIFCDRYPYIAGSTGLSLYFPMWAKEGTTGDFLNRLKDPALDSKIRSHVAEQEKKLGSWDNVLLSSVISKKNRHFQGKSVLEAAKESGKEAYDFMRDLLIEERAQVGMITFMMKEENLKKILAHPLVGVGCDGSAVAPYGPLSRGKPHPRNYGTFPRVLGKYVREEKVCSPEEMIKKMTSIPAARFGFERRGAIKPGHYADLVIFDPEHIADRATWTDPHQYPVGVEYVIVNGQVVIEQGEHTGVLKGRILRKKV